MLERLPTTCAHPSRSAPQESPPLVYSKPPARRHSAGSFPAAQNRGESLPFGVWQEVPQLVGQHFWCSLQLASDWHSSVQFPGCVTTTGPGHVPALAVAGKGREERWSPLALESSHDPISLGEQLAPGLCGQGSTWGKGTLSSQQAGCWAWSPPPMHGGVRGGVLWGWGRAGLLAGWNGRPPGGAEPHTHLSHSVQT